MAMADKDYYLYIIECVDNTLYTGITTNVSRRLKQHNAGKASKYTRSRRPVRLLVSYLVGNRSEASKEEYRVKKLKRKEKLKWIRSRQIS
jgi:putative endonuclease